MTKSGILTLADRILRNFSLQPTYLYHQDKKQTTTKKTKSTANLAVAYAGFSKGGAGKSENLRLLKTRMKIFQPKTRSVFLPKIR